MIKNFIKQKIRTILPGNFPDFMIIGAQKSGTTSLHDYLSQHPSLRGPKPFEGSKEIHYFDRLVYQGYDLNWYKNQFYRSSLKKQLFYEATPKYIYLEEVASQISEIKSDVKFILTLRNPVDRAYSAWNMYRDIFEKGQLEKIKHDKYLKGETPIYKYLYKGRKTFPNFREALDIELELINNSNKEEDLSIIRRGLYKEQIGTYFKYFERNQFLIVGFRDLIENTERVLNDIYDFLDVESIPFDRISIRAKNKRQYKAPMSDEGRTFLESFYAQPNKELFQLLGHELNW